jgi:hypothetical protein
MKLRLGLLAPVLLTISVAYMVTSHNSAPKDKLAHVAQLPSDWEGRLVDRATAAAARRGSSWPSIAVFQSKSESMPQGIKRKARETIGGGHPLGLQWDQSQFLKVSRSESIWLVPGASIACMFGEEALVAACDSNASIEDRGLLLETYRPTPQGQPSNFAAVGLIPNWANSVRLDSGGMTEITPIRNNVFSFHADAPIRISRLLR